MPSEDRIPVEDREPLKIAVLAGERMRGCICEPDIKLISNPVLPVEQSVTVKLKHHRPCPNWHHDQTDEWFSLDIPASPNESYGMTVEIAPE